MASLSHARAMRYAVNLPNFGPWSDAGAMASLATAAEEAGWDGFFVWDHIVGWDGLEVGDPWVILTAVATATGRMRLGPMVTPVPRRRPWVLARQAVSLDRLSGGRLTLGVGIGFPPDEEFGSFGEPTGDGVRAGMLDEGLEILTGMWSGRPFGFEGAHYRVAERAYRPAPIQSPRIPIWVAGMWPHRRPFLRAARWDGVFPIAVDMPRMLTAAEVGEIVALVAAHRSHPTPFDVSLSGPPLTSTELAAYARAGVTWYHLGPSPDGESIEQTRAWVEAGPPPGAAV